MEVFRVQVVGPGPDYREGQEFYCAAESVEAAAAKVRGHLAEGGDKYAGYDIAEVSCIGKLL